MIGVPQGQVKDEQARAAGKLHTVLPSLLRFLLEKIRLPWIFARLLKQPRFILTNYFEFFRKAVE
jgi:hypothetical protein